MTRPVLDVPLPIAAAHRGSRLLWPENTMAAFQGAVDLGFLWLETDLHVTRDGVIVTFHDDTLRRTTGSEGTVAEMDWADLEGVDAGYRHGRYQGYPFRGKGIGKRATFAFLYHTFMIRNFEKVYIYSTDVNIRNLNLNSHFGFILEGVFLHEFKVADTRQDVVRMGLMRSHWLEIFS